MNDSRITEITDPAAAGYQGPATADTESDDSMGLAVPMAVRRGERLRRIMTRGRSVYHMSIDPTALRIQHKIGAHMNLVYAYLMTEVHLGGVAAEVAYSRAHKILLKRHDCSVPYPWSPLHKSWAGVFITKKESAPLIDYELEMAVRPESILHPVSHSLRTYTILRGTELFGEGPAHAVSILFVHPKKTFLIVDGTYLFARIINPTVRYDERHYRMKFSAISAELTRLFPGYTLDRSQMIFDDIGGGDRDRDRRLLELRKFRGFCVILVCYALDAIMCANGNMHSALRYMRTRVDDFSIAANRDILWSSMTTRFFSRMLPYMKCLIINRNFVTERVYIFESIRPMVDTNIEYTGQGVAFFDFSKLDPLEPYSVPTISEHDARMIDDLREKLEVVKSGEATHRLGIFGYLSKNGRFHGMLGKWFDRELNAIEVRVPVPPNPMNAVIVKLLL